MSVINNFNVYDILYNFIIQDGDTPLHDACSEGKIECIKLLVYNGANVNIKNKFGKVAADKVQPQDSNRTTLMHLMDEAKKGNVVHHCRHVLRV